MALAKIPTHFLKSIEIDAILLTKLRENKWDKIHEELLSERPVLNLQTSYDNPLSSLNYPQNPQIQHNQFCKRIVFQVINSFYDFFFSFT